MMNCYLYLFYLFDLLIKYGLFTQLQLLLACSDTLTRRLALLDHGFVLIFTGILGWCNNLNAELKR